MTGMRSPRKAPWAAMLGLALVTSGCAPGARDALGSADVASQGATPASYSAREVREVGQTSGVTWIIDEKGLEFSTDRGRTFRSSKPSSFTASEADLDGSAAVAVATAGDVVELGSVDDVATGTWRTTSVQLDFPVDGAATVRRGSREFVLARRATSSGVSVATGLRSNDAGASFSRFEVPAFGELAVSPAASRLVLTAGPLDDVLYTSQDSGGSWVRARVEGVATPARYRRAVLVDETSGFVLVSDGSGLRWLHTSDGGASWQPSGQGFDIGGDAALAGVGTVLDGKTLVTVIPGSAGADVYRSADGGRTQERVATGAFPPGDGVIAVAGDRATVAAIVATSTCPSGKASCQSTAALYVSDDAGMTWGPRS